MTSFHKAGRKIGRRLQMIATISWLNLSVAILAGVLLGAIIGMRLFGVTAPEWEIAGGAVGLWLVAIVGIARLGRKTPFQALAKWDEVSGGKSTLASAHFFEANAKSGGKKLMAGEELHLEKARQLLAERAARLKRDLPIPRPHWSWLALLLALGFVATPGFKAGIALEDLLITDSMRARAEAEAERLAEERAKLDELKDLSPEERERIKELGEMLDETSEMLSAAGEKTSRELLEELEARARAAEDLANELGGDEEDWASKEMLEEMARHADTADLAAALQDKNAEHGAGESDKLAEKLADPKLPIEAESRIDQALTRTMEKATEDDKSKPVGEHVGQAAVNLEQDQAEPAAKDFSKLAQHFRDLARREKARDDLKKLADQLRDSGANIAESQLEQMQQLGEGNQGQGQPQPPPGAQDLAQAPMPNQMPGPQNQGVQQMQAPGLQNQGQNGQDGQNQQGQALQAPVPGMPDPNQAPQPGQQGGMMAGQQPGQGEQGGLSAPVPGQAPNGAGAAAMLGGNGGGATASGSGLQAGVGTAEMGTKATEAMRAAKDALVDAQINEDGDSRVQRVEGGVRQEAAQAQKREAAVNFISVEEEALDEKALPVSRRDQVLRYFTALRKEFEDEDSE